MQKFWVRFSDFLGFHFRFRVATLGYNAQDTSRIFSVMEQGTMTHELKNTQSDTVMASPSSSKHSLAVIQGAIAMVKDENVPIATAAKAFGLPYSTLREKLTGRRPIQPQTRYLLTDVEEQKLVEWVSCFDDGCMGRTYNDIRDKVRDVLALRGASTRTDDGRPSKDWMQAFLKRHPEISLRSTQAVGKPKRIKMASSTPNIATDAVLVKSEPMPEGSVVVKGYDFNEGVNYKKMFESMSSTGFQATSVGNAITEINRMIDCKLQEIPADKVSTINPNPNGRQMTNCSIFLSYTSNLVSAGTREVIRYLVQHNMVDCLVSTAGGVEEDFIKCLAPTYLGDFSLPGRELRSKGINRIGNLLVPNSNYCLFEDWFIPILDTMLQEQKEQGTLWTPSKLIWRLGKEIDNPDSIYYWAYKNSIPVFCPALTDGSIGDMLYFHSYRNPGLVIDVVQDIGLINNQAVRAVNTGMIILGGGLVKHHTCNANLMRNGADFSVFVNTASEFDGSDSGARPDEAISWGKIKASAKPVKVYADASVIAPLLVAETFAGRQKDFEDFFAKTRP